MKLGSPIHESLPWVRALSDLDEARQEASLGPRLDAMRRRAERLGDALREGPRVASVRTFDISDLIYPTRYAYQGALRRPWPYVSMRHRCLLVQLDTEAGPKNLLFNPTDRESSKATPFFAQIVEKYGWAEPLIARPFKSVEQSLASVGLGAEDIDLLAFDHFHTQDLRPTLGTTRGDGIEPALSARFPNAKLLAPRVEWNDWDRLHPMQRAWFVEHGKRDVDMERVVLTDDDLFLGDGCVLVQTPGHTSGNQTLFVHADQGVFGCSENGTSVDNWSPYESRLPGLRGFARDFDVEVVLNANTPEAAATQYTSMIVERSIVDRVPDAPAFVQMLPSSEVTPSPLTPGLQPSVVLGERTSGRVRT
ncbi:MAG: hypothetical protein AB8I08_01740 [Sandaracinaceae bacterium]